MSVIGIVSEFNPFHNGHKYLIDSVRKDGDTVVCVMSGNFVQRAEPSLFTKQTKTRTALAGGIDAVLELPFLYAVGSTECFAENAVRILCEFGCDSIAFGVEDGNRDAIINAAVTLGSPEFCERVEKYLCQNESFPAARQKAFSDFGINFDLSLPNNILAVAYTKAVIKNYPDVKIIPVKRKNAAHDTDEMKDGFTSASNIRKMITENNGFSAFVPANVNEILSSAVSSGEYCDYEKYSLLLMSELRKRKEEYFRKTAYMTEELFNRVIKYAGSALNATELFEILKTKRYTHSRIRRAVLCSYFGITNDDIKIPAPYVRVLGFKQDKINVYRSLVSASGLPVAVSYRDFEKIGSAGADRVFSLEAKASDIHSIILKNPRPSGTEESFKIIKE